MNSGPRWLISITDMPLPCQSSISLAACCRTSFGRTAGPAEKLNTWVTGRTSQLLLRVSTSCDIVFWIRGIMTRLEISAHSAISCGIVASIF